MKSELFFEIPNDVEIMVKIIEAIPSDWAWIDGMLVAPKDLIDSGSAKENTGFTLKRFHDIGPTIIGSYNKERNERNHPDLYAIMVEHKLPGFVTFDEAGYECDIATFEVAKRIASGFVRKGYLGSLCFFQDCYANRKHQNPASCWISFKIRKVEIKWHGNYGGKEESVAPIITVCRSLKLKEHAPEKSVRTAQ